MSFLVDIFRPSPTFEPRSSEIAAAKALSTDNPFLPPNIDLTFFYGAHGTKKDFEPLARLLTQSDVFITEVTAWRLTDIEYRSRISQGDKRARKEWELEERKREGGVGRVNPFIDAELKALLGSNIRTTIIDYAVSDPRADEIQSHFVKWGLFDKLVPSWTQTLDNIINYARHEARLEEHREYGMLKSIGPRLFTLIAEDPDLNQKERVKVSVQQGEAHAFYYPKFEELASRSGAVSIEAVFQNGEPRVVEHFDQLTRTFREGSQPVIQQERRELAMRALARRAMSYGGIDLKLTNDDRRGLLRKLPPPEEMVERFSVDDIKGFHKRFVEANGLKARK